MYTQRRQNISSCFPVFNSWMNFYSNLYNILNFIVLSVSQTSKCICILYANFSKAYGIHISCFLNSVICTLFCDLWFILCFDHVLRCPLVLFILNEYQKLMTLMHSFLKLTRLSSLSFCLLSVKVGFWVRL